MNPLQHQKFDDKISYENINKCYPNKSKAFIISLIFNLHLIVNSLSHFRRSKITDLAICTGILVNKDTTSKESIKSLSLILKLDILSINSNEFFIDKLLEFIKGVNIFITNLERLYKGELIKETIGPRGQSGL